MTDDDYLVQLLRLLDDEPSRPTRVDLTRAIADARRRRRVRRVASAGGAVALTVVVVAALPVTFQLIHPDFGATDHPGSSAASASVASPGVGGSAQPLATDDPVASPARTASAPPAASAVPVRLAPPAACAIEQLPVPGGHPMSLVTGADPSGWFLLGRSYPSGSTGRYSVLVWDNGKATRVDVPGDDQSLTDATSTGTAVGRGWGENGPTPYLVRDGRVTRLPVAGTGVAQAINEAGRIAGTRDDRQPVIWPTADSKPVDLALPGPRWRGEAVDIDEDGTVVGVVSADDGQSEHAQIWLADGTGRLLPEPTVNGRRAASFRPLSIRHGWVTGVAGAGVGVGETAGQGETSTGKEGNVPVRLHLASGRFVGLPTGDGVWPQHGNAQGWVVGSTADGRATLLTDQGALALPGLKDRRGSPSNLARTVSDDGRTVAGQNDNAKGEPQAVRWRCR